MGPPHVAPTSAAASEGKRPSTVAEEGSNGEAAAAASAANGTGSDNGSGAVAVEYSYVQKVEEWVA